ncbi:conserved hypothetical protein [Frankia sp. AiPs1]|uniref:hypothetical protein n=1 Tax=Frankia sp. AiPa1 TaxID=573492 RepID=UPI00202AD1DF|nr:hypothetical protein [Frankia sp. AiPa1]MCL9760563.1 hypothetical protein [Frankia sp. AiPa1]
MRVHHNSVSSLRRTFASYLAERAEQRELVRLLDNPDLSPAARQEMTVIIFRAQGAQDGAVSVPVQRTAAVRRSRAVTGAAVSR